MPGELGSSGIQSPSRSAWNGSTLRWAAAALGLWLVLVGAWTTLKPAYLSSSSHSVCLFHSITGMPCPTCGGTRAVLALGRGEVTEALRWNPLVIVVTIAGSLWFAGRAVFGERARIEVTVNGRRLLWCAAAMLGIANWAWVIAQGN